MKAKVTATESPEAKAARLAEEARADAANLASVQDTLDWKTRQRLRRYGLIKSTGSGSQPDLVGSIATLAAASGAGTTGLSPTIIAGGGVSRNGNGGLNSVMEAY